MLRSLPAQLALPLAALLVGCGDGPLEVVCEGKVIVGEDGRQRCVFDGPAPGGPVLTDTPEAPPSIPDVAPDPGPPEDAATETEEDTGPDPEWQCPAEIAPRVMGSACERHCECQSGYCYDGPYLGDFRFCTRECGGVSGSCEEGGGDIQRFTCLNLHVLADESGDKAPTHICQRICSDMEDCRELSSAYDACGTPCPSSPVTCWKGEATIALPRTCQITAEVQ